MTTLNPNPLVYAVGELVRQLPLLATSASVIPWGCPVVAFGNPSTARVATVGINPSNREFVDEQGQELDGHHRRFHTLHTLRLRRWEDATDAHCRSIHESCTAYFNGNPYGAWFSVLDRLLGASGHTYFGFVPTACHLDLVPYATAVKWTSLTAIERSILISAGRPLLAQVILASSVEVLVLNGRAVVDGFRALSGITFKSQIIKSWTLPRRSGGVTGIAYSAQLTELCGLRLSRPVLVLGYNHNLQSSFGVTTQVKNNIGRWLGECIGSTE